MLKNQYRKGGVQTLYYGMEKNLEKILRKFQSDDLEKKKEAAQEFVLMTRNGEDISQALLTIKNGIAHWQTIKPSLMWEDNYDQDTQDTDYAGPVITECLLSALMRHCLHTGDVKPFEEVYGGGLCDPTFSVLSALLHEYRDISPFAIPIVRKLDINGIYAIQNLISVYKTPEAKKFATALLSELKKSGLNKKAEGIRKLMKKISEATDDR